MTASSNIVNIAKFLDVFAMQFKMCTNLDNFLRQNRRRNPDTHCTVALAEYTGDRHHRYILLDRWDKLLTNTKYKYWKLNYTFRRRQ